MSIIHSYSSIRSAYDSDGSRYEGAIFGEELYISGYFHLDIHVEDGYIDLFNNDDGGEEDIYELTPLNEGGYFINGVVVPEEEKALLEALSEFSDAATAKVDFQDMEGNVFSNNHLTRNFIIANTNWKGYDGVDLKNTWKEIILSYPRTLDFDGTILQGEGTIRPYGAFFTDLKGDSIGISAYGPDVVQGKDVVNGTLNVPQIDLKSADGKYTIIRPGSLTIVDSNGSQTITPEDSIEARWGGISGNIADQTDLAPYILTHAPVQKITGSKNIEASLNSSTGEVLLSVNRLLNNNNTGLLVDSTTGNWEIRNTQTSVDKVVFDINNGKVVLKSVGGEIELNSSSHRIHIMSALSQEAWLGVSPLSSFYSSGGQAIRVVDLDQSVFEIDTTTKKIKIVSGITSVVADELTITGTGTSSNKLMMKGWTATYGSSLSYLNFEGDGTNKLLAIGLKDWVTPSSSTPLVFMIADGTTGEAYVRVNGANQTFIADRVLSNHDRLDGSDVVALDDFNFAETESVTVADFLYPDSGTYKNKMCINPGKWKVKQITEGIGITLFNQGSGSYAVQLNLSGDLIKAQTATSNSVVFDTDSNGKLIANAVGRLVMDGPYATTGDIPVPYHADYIYLVGTTTPYMLYAYVAATASLVAVGDTSIYLPDYYTKVQIDAMLPAWKVKEIVSANANLVITDDGNGNYTLNVPNSLAEVSHNDTLSGKGITTDPLSVANDLMTRTYKSWSGVSGETVFDIEGSIVQAYPSDGTGGVGGTPYFQLTCTPSTSRAKFGFVDASAIKMDFDSGGSEAKITIGGNTANRVLKGNIVNVNDDSYCNVPAFRSFQNLSDLTFDSTKKENENWLKINTSVWKVKQLTAGSNITLTESAAGSGIWEIASTASAITNVEHDTSLTGAGTSASPLGINTANWKVKDLTAGSNITLTESAAGSGIWEIAAAGGSGGMTSVEHGTTLTGDGTTAAPLNVNKDLQLETLKVFPAAGTAGNGWKISNSIFQMYPVDSSGGQAGGPTIQLFNGTLNLFASNGSSSQSVNLKVSSDYGEVEVNGGNTTRQLNGRALTQFTYSNVPSITDYASCNDFTISLGSLNWFKINTSTWKVKQLTAGSNITLTESTAGSGIWEISSAMFSLNTDQTLEGAGTSSSLLKMRGWTRIVDGGSFDSYKTYFIGGNAAQKSKSIEFNAYSAGRSSITVHGNYERTLHSETEGIRDKNTVTGFKDFDPDYFHIGSVIVDGDGTYSTTQFYFESGQPLLRTKPRPYLYCQEGYKWVSLFEEGASTNAASPRVDGGIEDSSNLVFTVKNAFVPNAVCTGTRLFGRPNSGNGYQTDEYNLEEITPVRGFIINKKLPCQFITNTAMEVPPYLGQAFTQDTTSGGYYGLYFRNYWVDLYHYVLEIAKDDGTGSTAVFATIMYDTSAAQWEAQVAEGSVVVGDVSAGELLCKCVDTADYFGFFAYKLKSAQEPAATPMDVPYVILYDDSSQIPSGTNKIAYRRDSKDMGAIVVDKDKWANMKFFGARLDSQKLETFGLIMVDQSRPLVEDIARPSSFGGANMEVEIPIYAARKPIGSLSDEDYVLVYMDLKVYWNSSGAALDHATIMFWNNQQGNIAGITYTFSNRSWGIGSMAAYQVELDAPDGNSYRGMLISDGFILGMQFNRTKIWADYSSLTSDELDVIRVFGKIVAGDDVADDQLNIFGEYQLVNQLSIGTEAPNPAPSFPDNWHLTWKSAPFLSSPYNDTFIGEKAFLRIEIDNTITHLIIRLVDNSGTTIYSVSDYSYTNGAWTHTINTSDIDTDDHGGYGPVGTISVSSDVVYVDFNKPVMLNLSSLHKAMRTYLQGVGIKCVEVDNQNIRPSLASWFDAFVIEADENNDHLTKCIAGSRMVSSYEFRVPSGGDVPILRMDVWRSGASPLEDRIVISTADSKDPQEVVSIYSDPTGVTQVSPLANYVQLPNSSVIYIERLANRILFVFYHAVQLFAVNATKDSIFSLQTFNTPIFSGTSKINIVDTFKIDCLKPIFTPDKPNPPIPQSDVKSKGLMGVHGFDWVDHSVTLEWDFDKYELRMYPTRNRPAWRYYDKTGSGFTLMFRWTEYENEWYVQFLFSSLDIKRSYEISMKVLDSAPTPFSDVWKLYDINNERTQGGEKRKEYEINVNEEGIGLRDLVDSDSSNNTTSDDFNTIALPEHAVPDNDTWKVDLITVTELLTVMKVNLVLKDSPSTVVLEGACYLCAFRTLASGNKKRIEFWMLDGSLKRPEEWDDAYFNQLKSNQTAGKFYRYTEDDTFAHPVNQSGLEPLYKGYPLSDNTLKFRVRNCTDTASIKWYFSVEFLMDPKYTLCIDTNYRFTYPSWGTSTTIRQLNIAILNSFEGLGMFRNLPYLISTKRVGDFYQTELSSALLSTGRRYEGTSADVPASDLLFMKRLLSGRPTDNCPFDYWYGTGEMMRVLIDKDSSVLGNGRSKITVEEVIRKLRDTIGLRF